VTSDETVARLPDSGLVVTAAAAVISPVVTAAVICAVVSAAIVSAVVSAAGVVVIGVVAPVAVAAEAPLITLALCLLCLQ
jgi:hypothetical protein